MLQDHLLASRRRVGAAFQGMRRDLAVQLRAGAIDPTLVEADESAITNAVQAHIAQEIDALSALHTILDPTQRAAAVAEVRAEQAGRAEEQPPPKAPSGRVARLNRLTRELGLDSDQQRRVAALPYERQPGAGAGAGAGAQAEHARRFDQVINAFTRDQFDARATIQSITPSPAPTIRERIQRETVFLSQLLSILRPDQRDKLALKIETRGWGSDSQPAGDTEGQTAPALGAE